MVSQEKSLTEVNFIYIGQELEREGHDRRNLSLPGSQLELLQHAVATGNNLSKC